MIKNKTFHKYFAFAMKVSNLNLGMTVHIGVLDDMLTILP